jgi:hypothetical protein
VGWEFTAPNLVGVFLQCFDEDVAAIQIPLRVLVRLLPEPEDIVEHLDLAGTARSGTDPDGRTTDLFGYPRG